MPHAAADVVRRYVLAILDAARTRDRERSEDSSTYTAEAIVQSQLRSMGLPMLVTQIRAELYYLYDKGLVKFHRTRVGRDEYFAWRITAEGVDVLEGTLDVPGVARA